MLVGNEADLVAPAIERALACGVDGFVIVETASRDSTPQVLRRYCNDPRFDITFLTHETVYGAAPPHPQMLWRDMVKRAKARFGADWLIRFDADEMLMAPGTNLKAICASATTDEVHLRRFNTLVLNDGTDLHAAAADPVRLGRVPVMARPFPNELVRSGAVADIPLILTHVAQRPMTRAASIAGYDAGGHLGLDNAQRPVSHSVANHAWIVHFWFTTEARFAGKARFLHDITNSVRSKVPGGWQWNRWASQAAKDPARVSAEFRRQVLDQATFDALQAQGRVAPAAIVDPAAFLSDPETVEADLRSLGFGAAGDGTRG